jgi:murein DD-endopeptidase MepM/ murein hydrolase activator NlpD
MIVSQQKKFLNSPSVTRVPFAKKLSRLRFVWFLLGTSFGAVLAYYLFSLAYSDPEYSKLKLNRAYALLESHIAPLPQISAALSANNQIAPIPATKAAQNTLVLPADVTIPVQRGDTLMSILIDAGVEEDEAYQVVESMKKIYNPKRLTVGQSLALHLDKNTEDNTKPSIGTLSLAVSPLKTVALAREKNNGFTTKEIKAPLFKGVARAGGTITSSLYQTGIDSGIPPQMLGEIINALSYDVDFQRDIKQGDTIDVVFERMHTDKNVTAAYGKVLYASLILSDKELTIYHHTSPDGFSGYYNTKGESVKKALLRTPINGAHITSGFGFRMHPLLGYSKMHKGVDFGAVTGTPIYAAGDGVIAEADRKGGYGNYVRVKHSNSYETAYGHTSRFAKGIHAGVHVKQGQVIAYVGSTGQSTGPHLHYEILVNGAQVNPSGVKFRTGQTLQGKDLVAFKKDVNHIHSALATLPQKSQVAALEQH